MREGREARTEGTGGDVSACRRGAYRRVILLHNFSRLLACFGGLCLSPERDAHTPTRPHTDTPTRLIRGLRASFSSSLFLLLFVLFACCAGVGLFLCFLIPKEFSLLNKV